MKNTYAVIMAGGVGSRFWPASRASHPKQLLDLTGAGCSMIAATVARLQPDIPPKRVLVVTSRSILNEVIAALPGVPAGNILSEPVGRNTAPCIGWAALHVARRNPDGIMAIMPSDHLVADREGFLCAVKIASDAAKEGALVTFGIKPDAPETGFGYIEMGKQVGPAVREVTRFVEKPSLEVAKEYVASGEFAWNSGMFFFKASRILDEIATSMPALMKGLQTIDAAIENGNEASVLEAVFPTLPSESIDYGIMEKAAGILCVEGDFGWSDLGSWEAAWTMGEKNTDGNILTPSHISVGSQNCLVRAEAGKVVALVGVSDLIVVDTGDALLISRRSSSQDVKQVVAELAARGRKDLL